MNERRVLTLSSLCAAAMALISVYAYFFLLPPQIPLFYSLARPQDQLAPKEWFFLLPLIAVLIAFAQAPFMRFRDTVEHNTTVRVLVLFSSFSVVLLAITFMRILFLVT